MTGIFGALHLVLTMIPLFVLTGGAGFISMGLVSSVVIGYILGPVYGTLSILLGSGLGVVIFNIGGFLGPVIPVIAPVAGAFIAGCLKEGYTRPVIGIYFIGLLGFLLSPIGFSATIYLWMHIIACALVVLLSFGKTNRWISRRMKIQIDDPEKSFLPVWLIVFIALLGDSLIGGSAGAYWFVYALGMGPGELAVIFIGTAILYPLERIAVSIVATAIILALMRALRGTHLSTMMDSTLCSNSKREDVRDETS
jgi:hypothetical protein